MFVMLLAWYSFTPCHSFVCRAFINQKFGNDASFIDKFETYLALFTNPILIWATKKLLLVRRRSKIGIQIRTHKRTVSSLFTASTVLTLRKTSVICYFIIPPTFSCSYEEGWVSRRHHRSLVYFTLWTSFSITNISMSAQQNQLSYTNTHLLRLAYNSS